MGRAKESLTRPRRRAAAWGLIGLVAGCVVALLLAAGAAPHRFGGSRAAELPGPFLEASHLPPLLRLPGETAELRYDIYCPPPGEDIDSGAACDAGGTVLARAGTAGPFRPFPLELDPGAVEGRYVVRLPREMAAARSGLSYYALLRDEARGAAITVPAGGAQAPQRSLLLERPIAVELGAHPFEATRPADARVVQARWGDGPEEVGLEPGPTAHPIGGASFDVTPSGTVTVLDEAHRRLLRWLPGAKRPVAVNGTIADLAVAEDGSAYVLETTTAGGAAPVVRVFAPNGRLRATAPVPDRTASQIRLAPEGPVVLQYPSGQWMPVERGGLSLEPAEQVARGRAGRPLPGGREVVVFRTGNEVRVALTASAGTLRGWRITSATPLGEVQLAEPFGSGVALVVRVYEEGRDEFVALVVDGRGLVRRLALESADWAETAPLSRFRLVGSSLYQLGSTPKGLFVDRHDLGARP